MKRRKLVTMGVSFLLCVGMVGAGFASWLITGNRTQELEGSIQVEEVTDQRISWTVNTEKEGSEGDADVYFGAPSTAVDNETGKWLISKTDATDGVEDPYEDLEITLWVTLNQENVESLIEQGYKSLKIFMSVSGIEYSTAIDDGYIVAPTLDVKTGENEYNNGLDNIKVCTNSDSTDGTSDDYILIDLTKIPLEEVVEGTPNTTTKLEYAITLKYTWGESFEEKNPFEYFNSKDSGGESTVTDENGNKLIYADYASKALTTLTKIDDTNMKIKLTGEVVKTEYSTLS